jgi:hypothetical protein
MGQLLQEKLNGGAVNLMKLTLSPHYHTFVTP